MKKTFIKVAILLMHVKIHTDFFFFVVLDYNYNLICLPLQKEYNGSLESSYRQSMNKGLKTSTIYKVTAYVEWHQIILRHLKLIEKHRRH